MVSSEFVGWIPSATGRLSFSAVGSASNNHRAVVCNKTSDRDFFVATETRASRDGPTFPSLLTLFGRNPRVHFVTMLRVHDGLLPIPQSSEPPSLVNDTHAELRGDLILLTQGSGFFDLRIGQLRSQIYASQDPLRSLERTTADIADTQIAFQQLWHSLIEAFERDPRTCPAFARDSVTISRTGECHLSIGSQDCFASIDARRDQIVTRQGLEILPVAPVDWISDAHIIAKHGFFFLRDLSHRHYHHSPFSDSGTTVYPWTESDDRTWRKETHYSLVRMAIGARRENDIASYKQAIGVIAYAEAFQRSLAGWSRNAGIPSTPPDYFRYDFTPLRQSIEASLSQLEYRVSEEKSARSFGIVVMLTVVGLIVASGQVFSANSLLHPRDGHPRLSIPTRLFWQAVEVCVSYPGSVILAAAFALFIGYATSLRTFRQLPLAFGAAIRAVQGIMGGLAKQFSSTFASWALTLALIFVLASILATLAVGAFYNFLRLTLLR